MFFAVFSIIYLSCESIHSFLVKQYKLDCNSPSMGLLCELSDRTINSAKNTSKQNNASRINANIQLEDNSLKRINERLNKVINLTNENFKMFYWQMSAVVNGKMRNCWPTFVAYDWRHNAITLSFGQRNKQHMKVISLMSNITYNNEWCL